MDVVVVRNPHAVNNVLDLHGCPADDVCGEDQAEGFGDVATGLDEHELGGAGAAC